MMEARNENQNNRQTYSDFIIEQMEKIKKIFKAYARNQWTQ